MLGVILERSALFISFLSPPAFPLRVAAWCPAPLPLRSGGSAGRRWWGRGCRLSSVYYCSSSFRCWPLCRLGSMPLGILDRERPSCSWPMVEVVASLVVLQRLERSRSGAPSTNSPIKLVHHVWSCRDLQLFRHSPCGRGDRQEVEGVLADSGLAAVRGLVLLGFVWPEPTSYSGRLLLRLGKRCGYPGDEADASSECKVLVFSGVPWWRSAH